MAKQPVVSGVCRGVAYCAAMALAFWAGVAALGQMPSAGPPGPPMPGPGMAGPDAPPTGLPAEEQVVEVKVEGNRVVSMDKILPHIHTRAGRPYDPLQIEKDVRELSHTRLFVTVRPFSKQVPGGRLVIFQVVERPVIQELKIIGNANTNTKTLKKECDLKVGDAADPFAVEEGRRKIEEFYQKKGYSKVRVTVVDGNKPGDLRVIYMVDEGPQQKISEVNFIGNSIASGPRLLTQVKSHTPYFFFFKGEVDRKQIDEDVDRLTAYYRGLGFFRARIDREVEFNEKQNRAKLTFVIDEGPRYKVRNISFIGNKKFPAETLAAKLKLKDGQYFNQDQMKADVTAVQDKYGSIGHVFAKIDPENRFLDEPGQLDLVYNVDEGDRYVVGRVKVEIKGENPHTQITTVLNRLSLRTGDIVDTRELRDSERRLKASGLFMVDPTKGAVPKIVYSPPESEDKDKEKEQVAGRPMRRTSYYPAEVVRPDNYQPLRPLPPGYRYADVVVQYDSVDDLRQDEQPTAATPTFAPPYVPSSPAGQPAYQAAPPSAIQGQQPYGAPQSRPMTGEFGYQPAPAPDGRVDPIDEEPTIVRGQTDAGASFPELPAQYPARNAAPATPPAQQPYPPGQNYPPAPSYPPPQASTGWTTAGAGNAYPNGQAAQGFPTNQAYQGQPSQAYQGQFNQGNQGQANQAYQGNPAYTPPAQAGAGVAGDPRYAAGAGAPGSVPPSAWGNRTSSSAPPTGQYVAEPAVRPVPQYTQGTPIVTPAAPGSVAGGQGPIYGGTPPPPAPQYGNPGGVPYPPPQGAVGAPAPQVPPAPADRVFGDASPYMVPTPTGEPLRDLELLVRADETQTGRLMFGVGVNSEAGVVGNIVLDEQNFDWQRFPTSWEDVRNGTAFRGGGQRFRAEAVPGTQVQRYMLSFSQPYLNDSDVSLGLSAFYYDRIYTEWQENRLGGRVSLGYQFTHDLTGSVAFQGMNVKIKNPEYPVPDLLEVVGDNALYQFSAKLAHDTRDNAFLPTEGHLIQFTFEETTGSFTYPRAEVEFNQFFKLYERPDGSGRHVLSLTTKAGVTGDNTPIFERYYAGGFSTIRGYRFRGVTPRDPVFGMGVGGDFELLASAQYLFPITADDMLRGVIFCDAGTIEPTISNWSDNFRVSPGFGVRVAIPMMGPAPIALDFAFPVLSQPGDQREIFSFFVGFNR